MCFKVTDACTEKIFKLVFLETYNLNVTSYNSFDNSPHVAESRKFESCYDNYIYHW